MLRFSAVFSLSLVLTSCYSPSLMSDDDIYIIRTNEVPVDESVNDETSYANFKSRNNGSALTASFYADDPGLFGRFPYYSDMWWFGMGYGNPYYFHSMCRPGSWGIPYYSPYMYGYINPIYMVDPFGSPYGFYPTAYSPWYLGGLYDFPMYGWNSVSGSFNGSTLQYNHQSGPRGTISGFGSPERPFGNTLKSTSPHDITHPGIPSETLFHSRLDNQQVIGQNRPLRTPTFSRGDLNNQKMNELRPVSDRGIQTPGNNLNNVATPGRPGQSTQAHPEIRGNDQFRPSNNQERGGSVRPSGSVRPAGGNTGSPVRRPQR